jgi:cation transport ATPase
VVVRDLLFAALRGFGVRRTLLLSGEDQANVGRVAREVGIAEAIAGSRWTLRIARQSIWAGLGLSTVAMGFAAAGHIPPTVGALLQEAIDVAVIVNALQAARSGPAA